MLQLNPPIPLTTPKGNGYAYLVINDGPEHDLFWVVLLDETGEIWTYNNKHVRVQKNITLGRTNPTEIQHDVDKPVPYTGGVVLGTERQHYAPDYRPGFTDWVRHIDDPACPGCS